MNWTTSFLWWPLMYRASRHLWVHPSQKRATNRACESLACHLIRPERDSFGPGMGQVARQLVQVDEGLGAKDEVEPALQLLEAEATLGEVLVQLGGEAVPVCIEARGPSRPPVLSRLSTTLRTLLCLKISPLRRGKLSAHRVAKRGVYVMHYEDEQVEIHKVVVGPIDNNVFVVRCRQSGEALLVDAANEHEQLLELCRDLGVRKVVETHGHWDHIQAVPQLREAGYEVAVRAEDAAMLPSYDLLLDDDDRARGRAAAAAHDPHARSHTRLDVLSHRGLPGAALRRHLVPGRSGQHRHRARGLSRPSSTRSSDASSSRLAPRRS